MSNATIDNATTGAAAELWDVRLATGDTRMTVDQIDAGFQQGWIDAATPVRAPGAFEWTTLGAAAGLDDAAETAVRDRPGAGDAADPLAAREYVESLNEEDIETVLREDRDRLTWSPRRSRRKRGIVMVALFGVLMGAGIFATVRWTGAFEKSLSPAAAIGPTAAPTTAPESAIATQPAKPGAPAVAPRTAAAKNPPARTPRHQPAKGKAKAKAAKSKKADAKKADAKKADAKKADAKKAKPAAKPATRPANGAGSTPSYGRLPGT